MILPTQVEEFREVFHEFDIDGDGTISIQVHLENVLSIVGLDISTTIVVHYPVKITLSYMQKTCDDAVKNLRKKCVNRDKM